MNYYERHIGDYLKDTAHLSLLEHGVYTRLLDVYYTREGSIPDDQAERLVAARTKDERAAVHAVLAEFFERHEDGWHQDRCDREIERFNAGEPDREVKKANTDNRLARHRDERRALFQRLTAAGQHADWNINMAALRALVAALPATGTATGAPPLPATAPATPATATQTQTPDTSLQKEKPPAGVQGARRALKNCPSEFLVTPELQRWARESVPLVDIRAETAIFRATERKVGITDWPKAWQKWMLSEQKRHAEQAARDARRGPADTGYGFETPAQRAARERVAEISGGLASRKPPGPSGPSLPMELPLAERVD